MSDLADDVNPWWATRKPLCKRVGDHQLSNVVLSLGDSVAELTSLSESRHLAVRFETLWTADESSNVSTCFSIRNKQDAFPIDVFEVIFKHGKWIISASVCVSLSLFNPFSFYSSQSPPPAASRS